MAEREGFEPSFTATPFIGRVNRENGEYYLLRSSKKVGIAEAN
jgi:hypothetical protein